MTHASPADFLEFLWIWNRECGQGTPRLHRRIARWLDARDAAGERRLLLMAFRGAGKSTLVGLWCAWQLHRRPETRILVLSADAPLAVRMVATVRRILERHPLCRHLLPGDPASWAADRFTVARAGVLRDPSMLAQGLAGNITGARADVIVCDDVEVAGNCDTAAKRSELRDRLRETEFVLLPGGTILYVGTPHTEDSLYRDDGEPFLVGHHRLVIPVQDEEGCSAWPERFPASAIAALRDRVGPLHFARQMLLRPLRAEAARLDPVMIIRYAEELDWREASNRPVLSLLGKRMLSGSGFWDPAYGRLGGDASVVAALFADGEGNQYLHRLLYLRADPNREEDPATQQCRAVAGLVHALRLPVLRVETNGIGAFLPALLKREVSRAGSNCSVLGHASQRAKDERIVAALEPALAARRLHAHESVFRTSFAAEMADWKPGVAGLRDDALDAVAGALLAEPVRLPYAPPPPRGPGWRG